MSFELSTEWQEYLIQIITFAGENPWKFVYYTLLCLSPFFALSAYLSYKLIQEIEQKEKIEAKRQSKAGNKLKVTRKSKKDE